MGHNQQYVTGQPSSFSNHVKRVAIIGSGGGIGKHLLEHLQRANRFNITAISRPDSKSKIPGNLKVTRVDYASASPDEDALVSALRDQDALVMVMSTTAPPEATTHVVRAAIKAGVPYIFPSWFGHDSTNKSLCDDSMLTPRLEAVRAEFDSSSNKDASAYIFLVCNFWYEFSLSGGPQRFGFDIPARNLTLFDSGTTPINTSTWPQCGRAVTSLLSLPRLPTDQSDKSPTLSQFTNRPVFISSFRATQLDMFESVKKATGTSDQDWTINHESARDRWRDGKDTVAQARKGELDMPRDEVVANYTKMLYSRMFFENGDGDYQSKRELDNEVLGLSEEDIDEATKVAVRMATEKKN